MRHIPRSEDKPVPPIRQWTAPNLICFTRAAFPPVASLRLEVDAEIADKEEADSVEESASGSKSELRGMSVKSSLNIARILSTLDWVRLGRCLHITLSYWKTWPRTKAELRRVKKCLQDWFERNTDCGLWRLEFHKKHPKRGRVPHWHCLAFIGRRCVGEFMDAVRRWWAQTEWPNSHPEGVHFSDGDGRSSWYLAMHAGKREQAPPFAVGRWWGYFNRRVLLSFQIIREVGTVLDRERVWWARLYRRRTGCKVRNEGGFSWFLPEVWQHRAGEWVLGQCDAERSKRVRGKNPF